MLEGRYDNIPLTQEESEWVSEKWLEAARSFRAWTPVHVWRQKLWSQLLTDYKVGAPFWNQLPNFDSAQILTLPPRSGHFPVYSRSVTITSFHLAAQARNPGDITDSYSISLPPCPNSMQIQDLLMLPLRKQRLPIHFFRLSTTTSPVQATNTSLKQQPLPSTQSVSSLCLCGGNLLETQTTPFLLKIIGRFSDTLRIKTGSHNLATVALHPLCPAPHPSPLASPTSPLPVCTPEATPDSWVSESSAPPLITTVVHAVPSVQNSLPFLLTWVTSIRPSSSAHYHFLREAEAGKLGPGQSPLTEQPTALVKHSPQLRCSI